MGSGFFLSFTFLCDIFLLQENSYRGKMIASNPRLIFFTQVGIQKGEQPSPSQHLYNRFHGRNSDFAWVICAPFPPSTVTGEQGTCQASPGSHPYPPSSLLPSTVGNALIDSQKGRGALSNGKMVPSRLKQMSSTLHSLVRQRTFERTQSYTLSLFHKFHK